MMIRPIVCVALMGSSFSPVYGNNQAACAACSTSICETNAVYAAQCAQDCEGLDGVFKGVFDACAVKRPIAEQVRLYDTAKQDAPVQVIAAASQLDDGQMAHLQTLLILGEKVTLNKAKAAKVLVDLGVAGYNAAQLNAAEYLMTNRAIPSPTQADVNAAYHLMVRLRIDRPTQPQLEATMMLQAAQPGGVILALPTIDHVNAVISANRYGTDGGTALYDVRRHVAWSIQTGRGVIPNGIAIARSVTAGGAAAAAPLAVDGGVAGGRGVSVTNYTLVWAKPGLGGWTQNGRVTAPPGGDTRTAGSKFVVNVGALGSAIQVGHLAIFSNIGGGGAANTVSLTNFAEVRIP